MSYFFTWRSVPAKLLVLAAASMLSSCTVLRIVEIDAPTSDCVGSGQHFCHYKTVRTSIWKPKNKINLKSECVNGISRVKVTTKPMDVVLGFVTAGFVVRQRIDWDCAQRSGSSDMNR